MKKIIFLIAFLLISSLTAQTFDFTPTNLTNSEQLTTTVLVTTGKYEIKNTPNDHDNDAIEDSIDLDDDNDGIPDLDEYGGQDPLADADNDNVPAYLDDDDNNNTVGDDNYVVEPAWDLDGDGVPNHFDLDSDGDGLYDAVESGRLVVPVGQDVNFDGILEGNVGANGLVDSLETSPDSGVIAYTLQDYDGDSLYDFLDIDDDNDLVLTMDEHPDDNTNGYPDDAWDTDMDGTPNYLDIDDDGDGTLSIDEDYNHNGNPADDDLNNNGIPDYLDDQVTASLITLSDNEVKIYPIPTDDLINISFNIDIAFMRVKLYTQEGKLLQSFTKQDTSLTTLKLPKEKGMYFLHIVTDKGELYKTVIKK